MRAMLSDAALARQAGRFVWLELDFDKEVNQEFLARHGVSWTPAFFILDPADERATATHFGGMTLFELDRFLDEGRRAMERKAMVPAAAALARGDELAGRGRFADAAVAYRKALRLAKGDSPERMHAVDALMGALQSAGDTRACAETAAREAKRMRRERTFASVVGSGLGCANEGEKAPWAKAARRILEPLAVEAVSVKAALRDDRFQLYQQLMVAAQIRGDSEALARFGRRWLEEIDGTLPQGPDERSALDVARVDAVTLLGDPGRALPALAASEQAMPGDYSASARLCAMAAAAKRYDEALDACGRGLPKASGPMGRTAMLLNKARALIGKAETSAAREVLEEAEQSARTIGNGQVRDHNLRRISQLRAGLHSGS